MSILYHATPEEVKLILIDPKIVEFTVYEGIPHLLIPVVTDPKKAAGALNWAVQEMQRRYNLFAENSVRDLGDYNAAAVQPNSPLEPMPQIVVIIDELADLMMTTSKEVEDAICRLAQKARAAGMHLIIATQRPTTDMSPDLSGKLPSRIALSVCRRWTPPWTPAVRKSCWDTAISVPAQRQDQMVRVQGCFTPKEIERWWTLSSPRLRRIQQRDHGAGRTEHSRHQGRGKGKGTAKRFRRAGTGQRRGHFRTCH
ncbi:MAG: FtsK/SpoIIIE domain-containing protein [Ruminococcus callidus]